MIKRLLDWLWGFSANRRNSLLAMHEDCSSATPKLRIGIVEGMNGRILEIATHKPNPHGSDWTYEFFVVQEQQKISDAVAMVLLLKGLDK